MTQLADLPPACLQEIAACLDLPSKCSWRLASRACCSSVSLGSISITPANVAKVVQQATCHTWRDVSQAVVLLTPEAAMQLDALCLGQWLNALPSLSSLAVSIYCYESGHEGEEAGGSSNQEAVKDLLLQLVPIPSLTSLSVTLTVEHGPSAARTSKAVTAAVCDALVHDFEQTSTDLDDASCMPNKSLALVTPALGLTPKWLQRFGAGLESLTKLCGVQVQMAYHLDIQQLGSLPSLVQLHVTCVYISGERGATCEAEVDGEARLGRVLAGLSHLQHLAVADFHGLTLPLLQDLQQLAHLHHLSLAGQVWTHGPIASEQLHVLATFPSLTSLVVDRLHLSEAGGLTLPGLQSLEFRWLWEGALLKLAGWQHLTSLSLTHLGYGNDWGLIRTLQALQELRLHHAGGTALLTTLLQTASQLPYLRLLAITGWSLPPLTFSHHASHISHSGVQQDPQQDDQSCTFEGEHGQARNQVADLESPNAGVGTDLCTSLHTWQQACDIAPDSHFCSSDGTGGIAEDTPEGQQVVECLSQLYALEQLEISNSSQSMVDAVSETAKQGGLRFLQQLRLTHLPHLCAEQAQELIVNLPGLTRLELGACGPPELQGFRNMPRLAPASRQGYVHVVWDVHEEMISATA